MVELDNQLSDELSKHILIVVGLDEGEVSIAIVIYGRDEGYSGLDYVVGLGLLSAQSLPRLSKIIGLTKPGLIDG